MSLLGQCPSCRTQYELDQEDIGQVLECECGTVLLACKASSFPTIPVACEACGATSRVESDDRRSSLTCVCGENVAIPSVVLRMPIQAMGGGLSTKKTLRRIEPSAGDSDVFSGSNQTLDDSSFNVDAEIAIVTVEDSKTPDARERSNRKSGSKANKTKSVSWGSWLSAGFVLLLLITSIIMFLTRTTTSTTTETELAEATAIDEGVNGEQWSQASDGSLDRPNATMVNDAIANLPAEPLPTLPEPSTGDTVRLVTAEQNRPKIQDTVLEFDLPKLSRYALPEPKRSRQPVPIVSETTLRMPLRSAVEKAFEVYEETQKLASASEDSKSQAEIDAYHRSLGTTIGLIRQVHEMSVAARDAEQVNNMRYLLAYLSYTAAQLPEAMLYGEAVARWGEQDEPATREAGMIALAAAQEACETQWGQQDHTGELSQMEIIASLLAERWPDEPQLDSIAMNLAYLYEAFNHPRKAIQAYDRISQSSKSYGLAQVSSGLVAWRLARNPSLDSDHVVPSEDSASEGITSIDPALRQGAKQRLTRGLKDLEKQAVEDDGNKGVDLPTETMINARLALSQIELTNGNRESAVNWLNDSSGKPLIDIIEVTGKGENKKKRGVPEATARQIYDVLLFVSQANGDQENTQDLLSKLSQTIDSAGQQVEATLMSMVKDKVAELQALPRVSRQQVESLDGLVEMGLGDITSVPTSTLLWLGESWGQIGDRAGPSAAQTTCYSKGADLFEMAMQRVDFPTASTQAAQLRRMELLRKSGQYGECLSIVNDVLAKTPNIMSLQMEAAELLQQIAMDSGSLSDLRVAIDGPEGFSPIWGWGRLVTSLHSMRWSQNATEQHLHQLLTAQYHLAECRYLAAVRSTDRVVRQQELASLERSVRTIIATMDSMNEWKQPFTALHKTITQAR